MELSITPSLALDLFYKMLRIRSVEERIATRYPEQKMRCPVHLSIGQEAVAVGVCKTLLRTDSIVSGHRAHAHYLAKGGNLKAMIAEIYGKAAGCAKGRGGSMHLVDLTVGMMGSTSILSSILPVGVGMAFADWLNGEDHVTVLFLGDAATEEGVFTECLNFASLKKLPILFVSENNLFSVYSPLNVRQSKERDLLQLARAHGIWAEKEDGNDVEIIYALSKRAVEGIREKKGPALLEFATYRFREHCGPFFDNQLCYRSEEEYQSWLLRCPIKLAKEKLLSQKLIDQAEVDAMQKTIDSEIDEAFIFVESSHFPKLEDDGPIYSA